MSLHTEAGFTTGIYTVTRPGVGSWILGRWVRASSTIFSIEACEHPVAGRSDDDQPQGQETSENRTLYTDTALRVSSPSAPVSGQPGFGTEADLVTIDGAQWVVTAVTHHKVISDHYVVTVERLYVGEAA